MLAASKLVGDQLRTSFEPASVMEFDFYHQLQIFPVYWYWYFIKNLRNKRA